MESRLFQALKAFKGADGCEANLFEEFKKIAEAAFFSGYFLINGGCKDAYKLKLTCIEFYYHEDDGNIKDKRKYLKGKEEFGYALNSVCLDEIQFLGDYYPKKLKNDSKELDRLYYGF